MTEQNEASADGVQHAEAAAEALAALAEGPGVEAARTLELAFTQAGEAIENSLVKAARTGELSLRALGEAIALTLAELVIDRSVDAAFGSILEAVVGGFSGARASGGFVTTGGAYLVGETGPEVFTPASAGSVAPLTATAPVNVHFHLGAGADAASLRRSQGQIAAGVAQAAARGRKYL